ncbi:hypothetical protein LA76x_1891 [Lysobacter antibioticus]|uniref:Uncharacterized protein n=1 Tax=Lysobacter antibioticus TaxID=84531 RepID=A0A0S2F972_LYSAN|nr:hypothetical protein LA76x_1891 [Lysobacter antibioticus]
MAGESVRPKPAGPRSQPLAAVDCAGRRHHFGFDSGVATRFPAPHPSTLVRVAADRAKPPPRRLR